MKVAYLSVQTREKDVDWLGEPDISYVGLCLEDFEPFSLESQEVVIYDKDNVSKVIEALGHANLVVCFGTYCFEVLNKYYGSEYPMYYDFAIFDILSMVLGEIGYRVYLETVANSLNMHRKVHNGKACVHLWKSGKLDLLKDAIQTDVHILKRAFDKIATSKTWEMIDPRTQDKVVLDISHWVKTAFSLSKDSVYDEVKSAIKLIQDSTLGLPETEFSHRVVKHLVADTRISEYINSSGLKYIYMTNENQQLGF